MTQGLTAVNIGHGRFGAVGERETRLCMNIYIYTHIYIYIYYIINKNRRQFNHMLIIVLI